MDEIEEIKRRIDIVELISTYLTLKKTGANYRAVCPFHSEKTPSFMVSPEKQIFKCFGCSEGGDVFSFIMKMENLEFPEALRMLADRAGVTLKKPSFAKAMEGKEGKDRKSQLYKLNDFSAKVFHKILTEHRMGKQALDYLHDRGITSQTIKEFMIGYAPYQKTLTSLLAQKGFTSAQIKEAGEPTRFFKRIMFPIRDAMGNVIAFTGRVLEKEQEPKYLNTADTIIFHKGRVLYNLHQAKGYIKQEKATIVVEGQMDVVASWQAGVKNVVASSGTALTKEHLQILYRYTPNIIFCFDSDTAGLATAKKAYEMAIVEGMNVKMILLGQYKDPGEMIAADLPAGEAGSKLWQKVVADAKLVIDWYFELAFNKLQTSNGEKKELTSQEKKEIAREILPVIKVIPDTIEQAHYLNLLAKRLSVNEDVVFAALNKVTHPDEKRVPEKILSKNKISNEEVVIMVLLYAPSNITSIKDKIRIEDLKSAQVKEIYKVIQKEYSKDTEKKFIENLKKKVSRDLIVYIDNLLSEAENIYADDEASIKEDLAQAISHLKQNEKEALKDFYAKEIQKAESKKDYPKLKKLIQEFQEAIK